MSVKISALPAVTTLDPTDILPVVKSGVTSKILFSSLKTLIGAQPASDNLDTYAGVTPTAAGLGLLQTANNSLSQAAFLKISVDSLPVLRYAQGVLSDIGGFAAASLDNDANLGGSLANSSKAPSQQAVKKYVDSRTGTATSDTSDDTIASAATLDLDATDGDQIAVTGAIGVTAITLAEKEQRTLVFDDALIFTASASLILPGKADTLTTEAGGFSTVLGLAGDVVQILEYQGPDRSKIIQASQLYLLDAANPGHFFGFVSGDLAGVDQSIQVSTNGTGLAKVMFPEGNVSGSAYLLAREIGNASTVAQVIPAATRTYIAGSNIAVPSGRMKIGTKFSWKFNLTKTAAGTAASTFDVCVGNTLSTGDTARLSFAKPGGSAAVDEGFVIIEAVVRGPISASGVMVGEFIMYHNLASTGHMTIPVACVNAVSSAFNLTTANLFVGVCLTTGASDDITIQQVSTQAFNL